MEPVARCWGARGCLGPRPGGRQGGTPGRGEREGQSEAGQGEHHNLQEQQLLLSQNHVPSAHV